MAIQLILWDIDGTLLQTEGAGRDAMGGAGEDLQGRAFSMEHIKTSGRLDSDIWRDLARLHGLRGARELEGRFRTAYFGRLKQRLASAYSEFLADVAATDLPAALQRDFGALHEAMTRVPPAGSESRVRASVQKMSPTEAAGHAAAILKLYTALASDLERAEPLKVVPAPRKEPRFLRGR